MTSLWRGITHIAHRNTKLNKIKAENAIASSETTGVDSEKQSPASAGGKKKGTRDGGGKGASAKKRKLTEVDNAEQVDDAEHKVEGVKKEEQTGDDDDN